MNVIRNIVENINITLLDTYKPNAKCPKNSAVNEYNIILLNCFFTSGAVSLNA